MPWRVHALAQADLHRAQSSQLQQEQQELGQLGPKRCMAEVVAEARGAREALRALANSDA